MASSLLMPLPTHAAFYHALCTPSLLQSLDCSTLPAPPIETGRPASHPSHFWPQVRFLREADPTTLSRKAGIFSIIAHCPSPARHLQLCRQPAFSVLTSQQAPESQWLWVTSPAPSAPKILHGYVTHSCNRWGQFPVPFALQKTSRERILSKWAFNITWTAVGKKPTCRWHL